MRQDNGIHSFENVLNWHGQWGQRITKFTAIGILKARIRSRFRKHRIYKKSRISIGNFDRCVADKLYIHSRIGLSIHSERNVHKKGQSK